jgi:hypothetical protein
MYMQAANRPNVYTLHDVQKMQRLIAHPMTKLRLKNPQPIISSYLTLSPNSPRTPAEEE